MRFLLQSIGQVFHFCLCIVRRFYPSKDDDGAIIRPLPRVKQSLSDASTLPHLVQLLLTFEPYLVEKVATLLYLVLEDNPRLPTLYLTGFFFFVLMYTGSNVLPIGRFLAMAHEKQVIAHIRDFLIRFRVTKKLNLGVSVRGQSKGSQGYFHSCPDASRCDGSVPDEPWPG